MLFEKIHINAFFKTKEFKLFLTIWLVYIFYIEMYGYSCMANSNSALTASIVNEGRFEVDTYYRSSCDVAFYNGHYYSGLAPGISFIGAPFYAAGKGLFYFFPDQHIDFFYEKLERYGETLPVDFYRNKKIISNYFPYLSKRQVLEHLVISTFILPVFTTTLFSAISAVLLYMLLKYFTNKSKLRIMITLLYAFGTLVFPWATGFFQRPIAIALGFAAFMLLFRLKHHKLKKFKSTLFFAGLLAGISVWFDYYNMLFAGLLFLYLLTFSFKIKSKSKKINHDFLKYINLKNFDWTKLISYSLGAAIPVILLLLYHYAAFENPFSTSYSYRVAVDYDILPVSQLKLPSIKSLPSFFEFFMYSPIIILALYGLYKATLKKDEHYHEAIGVAIFFILTFIYASALGILYPEYSPSSHNRYMQPIVPYLMIFLSYIFTSNGMQKNKKSNIKNLVIIIGLISLFLNWTFAQFGGHGSLTEFNLEKLDKVMRLLTEGPSSSFLSTLASVFGGNSLIFNIIGLAILASVIFLIWKPYLSKNY